MQNWTRQYSYIHDYQNLVYDYYSKHAIAFLTTYWNIDSDNTVWDNTDMLNGSYERIGDLSGIKYNKYLLLPIYFPDEISTAFDGQNIGQIKNQETTVVIPSTYGITPLPGDFIKLEQEFLKPTNDIYPLFVVSGVEIHPNTDKRFWKLKLKVFQSRTTTEIDDQLEETYTFFDYDKTIHTIADSIILARLLSKSSSLKDRLQLQFDQNSGLLSL